MAAAKNSVTPATPPSAPAAPAPSVKPPSPPAVQAPAPKPTPTPAAPVAAAPVVHGEPAKQPAPTAPQAPAAAPPHGPTAQSSADHAVPSAPARPLKDGNWPKQPPKLALKATGHNTTGKRFASWTCEACGRANSTYAQGLVRCTCGLAHEITFTE